MESNLGHPYHNEENAIFESAEMHNVAIIDNDDEIESDPDFINQDDLNCIEPSLRIGKWLEGLTTNMLPIGSTHAGRVRIGLYINQEGRIQIQKTRLDKEVCSAQIYSPFFKFLLDKNSIKKITDMIGMPGIAQEVLSNRKLFHSDKTPEMSRELAFKIRQCVEIVKNAVGYINSTEGSNTARMEYFFQSSFGRQKCDIKMHVVNPYKCFLIANENAFFGTYKKVMLEVITPLERVFVDQEGRNYETLSPEARTMLLLQAELIVQILEFPFVGKVYSAIKKCLTDDDGPFWHVPAEYTVPLSDFDVQHTGMTIGVKSCVLRVPRVDFETISRPSADDNTRILPSYVQMGQGSSNIRSMPLQNIYKRCVGLILGLLWEALHRQKEGINGEVVEEEPKGFFDLPPYAELATLDKESVQELVTSVCKIFCNAYDFQWRQMVNAKTVKRHYKKQVSLHPQDRGVAPVIPPVEDFPTTVQQYNECAVFAQSHPLEICSGNTIKSPSKLFCIESVFKIFS